MRYASPAFRTLYLLDLMSSSGISVRFLTEWSLVRKCSETVLGLEILDGLSTGQRCSLKRSLSRRLVSPMYCLGQWFGFTCRVECVCLSLTLSLYVRPWRRKAVPSEILVTKIYILDLKINLASFVWYFYIQLSRSFIRIQSFFFVTLVLAPKIEIIRNKHR